MNKVSKRDFFCLIMTDVFSKFADSMDNVVITLLVIKLTGSSIGTGIMLAITTIPGLLFSVLGGTLADIKSQRKIISIMTLCQAFLLIALVFIIKINRLNFFILCSILFILESFSRFYTPAFTSATLNLVSKDNYKQAVSTLTTLGSIMQMIGSAISSTLVSSFGYTYTILVNSISYLCSSFFSVKLNVALPERKDTSVSVKSFFMDMYIGIDYVRKEKTIFVTIALISILNFVLAWFDVALPFFITECLNAPIESLGYIKAVSTFAFVIAGIIMAKEKRIEGNRAIFLSIITMGIFIIVITFTKKILLTAVFWGGAAFFRTIASLLLMSRLATSSDEKIIGRVIGIFTLITSVSIFFSHIVSGILVKYVGAAMTFKIAGEVFLICGIFYKLNEKNYSQERYIQ